MNQFSHCRFTFLLVGILFLLGAGLADRATAQTSDSFWADPINISKAGSAVKPVLAVDAEGIFHLFWQVPDSGFVYSRGNGREWSEPAVLRLPFTEPAFYFPGDEGFEEIFTPQIVIDTEGIAHGFWLNSSENLMYSRAPLDSIAEQTAWTFPVAVAETAAGFNVVIDSNGRIHFGYIRPRQTVQFPAGVYHRSSPDGGASWTEAVLLYESQYLSVTAEQAHIILAVSGDLLFMAWDNRLLDSVFMARSVNGGVTWDDPMLVDSRTSSNDPETIGPSNIEVDIMGEDIFLTWRSEPTTEYCVQNYQWSRNRGDTWQPSPLVANEGFANCPLNGEFIPAQDNLLFLMTNYENDALFQVWDGTQWSSPASQEPLARFTNPQTFRPVELACHQTAVTPENQLFVMGCGRGFDFDIWALSRPLGSLGDWSSRFLPAPAWSPPVMVASSQAEMAPPQLVAAGDGRLHAIWSQPTENPSSTQDTPSSSAIIYTRLNAGRWSPPRPVVKSPNGKSEQLAFVADRNGNLFLVWSGGEAGQIYFSRAVADRASSVTEWTEPLPLPSPREAGSWPDITIDPVGNLYVAYAIPFNDDRGIYLTKSADTGDTWEEQTRVFDGSGADWEMVGQPHLTITASGSLHLVWVRHTLPTGTGPLALFYARSADGGQSWSEPQLAASEPVVWSGLASINERSLHRAWLANDGGRLVLSHQYSIDDGLSWSTPGTASSPDIVGGQTALVELPDGPHLLQLAQTVTDNQRLLVEWLWDGARWRPGERLYFGQDSLEMDSITAVAAPDGRFGIVFSKLLYDQAAEQLFHTFFYTQRSWEALAVTPTPLPSLTPTPPIVATSPPLVETTPTPIISFATENMDENRFSLGPFSADNETGSLILSVLPAALIVVITFVVGLRIIRSR